MDSGKLLSEFKTLIEAHTCEAEVQTFLEENPLLLTAFFYRYPEGDVVISQFPLGADFRADFAVLTFGHTEGLWLHLVELERPSLRLFTRADEFTAEANHAFQQLHDWASWCNAHKESLLHTLAPLVKCSPGLSLFFNTAYILIAGRRSEVSTPRRRERLTTRANLQRGSIGFRTWDGFLALAEENINWHRWKEVESCTLRCVTYRTQGLFEKDVSGGASCYM